MDFRTDEEKNFDRLADRVCELERALGITLGLLLTAIPELEDSDRQTLRECKALIEE